jgi:[CysO sulfur-carrier protein]-S-L-cysteine hydrolase
MAGHSAADGPVRRISPATLRRIEAHARDAYPAECCGAVVDLVEGRQEVVLFRNVQDEMHRHDPARYPRTARTAYTPHAGDFMRAHELWEREGNRLVAFYHSHPDHDAYFSEEDVLQATPFGEPSYPQALQLVVSVYAGVVKTTKAFRWSEAAQSYLASEFSGD